VRIAGQKAPEPEPFKIGMGHYDRQQPLSQSPLPELFQDIDVAKISKGRIIGYHAGKADLLLIFIYAKAERMLKGKSYFLTGSIFRPVGSGKVGINFFKL
jgi:hypothetical protein